MAGVFQSLGLKRQVTITAPVPLTEARANLAQALAQDLQLGSGRWQLSRRYWGQLNYPHLTLHGPRARRQFCFLTQGHLHPGPTPETTQLRVTLTLGRTSETQLLLLLTGMVILVGGMMRWFALVLVPLFSGFFYVTSQWHFSHYSAEIAALLYHCMVGADPTTKSAYYIS